MGWGARAKTAAGVALVSVYALPLLWPPGAAPLADASASAGLFGRLFPGVPPLWVATRLACLAAGALLLAWNARPPAFPGTRDGVAAPLRRTTSSIQIVALVVAGIHALTAFAVAELSVLGQVLYIVALAVPAAVFAASSARPERGGSARRQPNATVATAVVAVVIALWVATRTADAWHSPRAADAVDMWRTFGYLARFSSTRANFLADSMDPELPGVTATPLFFQGLPVLALRDMAPTLAWVQAWHIWWAALSAAGVAWLAAAFAGPASAPVAAAALLWSPFVLTTPLNPTPTFIGPLFATALGVLAAWYRRGGSPTALAALGGVAGLSITYPALVPLTLLTLAATAWTWHRRGRPAPLVVAAALLTFTAAALPGLPGVHGARDMWAQYAAPSGRLSTLQQVLFGQVPSVRGAASAWAGGASHALDVAMGTLLSPFAVARTPIRLWGDTLFDPIGASLAAIGLVACMRTVRRERYAALLLAALAAALLPGLISSYDQPSLLRVFALPVPVALLAAAGFHRVTAGLSSRAATVTATAAVLAIVAGGAFLFDRVNPAILGSSPLGMIFRALAPQDLARSAVLTTQEEDARWLYLDEITSQVPVAPVPVLTPDETDGLMGGARGAPELVFWTPAVEETGRISYRLCQRWKTAALYTIVDRTGTTRLNAARPQGHGWIPALPRTQWTVETCAPGLSFAGGPAPSAPTQMAAVAPPESLWKPDEATRFGAKKGRDLAGANLSGKDLRGEQLAGATLSGAKLVGANLAGADLRSALLADADLTSANLGGARLSDADLSRAVLANANSHGADLAGATLTDADLTSADLGAAALGRADLRGARLTRTKLGGAKLIDAKLSKADLSTAELAAANFRGAKLDEANLEGADLQSGDLAGADLSAARLARADLSGLILRDVSFERADLSGARLARADLGGANLRGAKLLGADASGARLAGAVLAHADLSRAVLRGADLTGADLGNAKLADTDLTSASLNGAKLEGLALTGANLAGVSLAGVKMPRANLAGANLAGADLRDCDLSGSDLTGVDLARTNLSNCNLTGAMLRNAKLAEADLRGTILDEADLAGANLANADLGGQRLRKAKLQGATLTAANLAAADLTGAELSGANFSQATLAGAKLAGANLAATKLEGAMISGADLTDARLHGADLDRAYLADVIWTRAECPDKSRSSDHGETCCGHHKGAAPAMCTP